MKKVLFIFMLLSMSAYSFDAENWQNEKSYLQQEAAAKQALAEKQMLANARVTENQTRYDAVYYKLALFPDVETKILYGDVEMQARVVETSLDRAELNLLDNIQVDSVFYNQRPAQFNHTDDILAIYFDSSIDAGQLFTTRVVYHGSPQRGGFGAFVFDRYAGKPMVWSLSEPFGARNWWPCKDVPADKADSIDIKVTVRSDLIVASNGSLRSVVEKDGKKIYSWHEKYPIATYLASIAVYPYYTYSDWYVNAQSDSMEVQFYVFPDHLSTAKSVNAKTVSMIRAYAELFGEYPFLDEKYGHAEFLWGGGMEHQTITSLGGYSESLIAHELAHQWWGDMVTCADFHHIWLNEGFATYTEALWWEYSQGADALHYDMSFNTYFGDETVYVENPLTDDIFYYPTTYQKSAWVLHMLRHVVGDDAFFQILHSYYTDYKFSTATTEQFRNVCERVSGKDLGTFFDQWIYKSGAPNYQWLWQKQAVDGGGWRVSGFVKQVQTFGPVFQMPIDLTIKTASGEHTFVIENDSKFQAFDFVVAEEPVNVQLDKDEWILKKVEQITQPEFVLQDIVLMNENGDPQFVLSPGQTALLTFHAQNSGVAGSDVQVQLQSSDPAIEIIKSSVSFGAVESGAIIGNADDAFVFRVAPHATSRLAKFDLVFHSAQGVDQLHSLQIAIGEPTLLIVDDDDGADYEKFYWAMAARNSIFAASWSIQDQGDVDAAHLIKYPAVLWFTGDAQDSTLTHDNQLALQNYISNGGHLLLSGQNIGSDLSLHGDKRDSLFYANVLHTAFVEDAMPDEAVVGVPGDPLGDRLAMRFNDVFTGAHNQDSKEVIRPLAPAQTAFIYLPSNKSAGIRFYDGADGGRIVYLGFGLEGVAGPKESTATEVLQKIMTWFDLATGISDAADGVAPEHFVLQQNFPNPFNPSTTIQFYVLENGEVQADIYNVRGRKIRTIPSRRIEAGWHFLTWDGKLENAQNAAGGVYFLKISYNSLNISQTKSVKMLKIE